MAAWSSNHVDRRIVIGIGLTGFAGSWWLTSHMASNWGFHELLVPQLARGLFVMLCIVPSVGMALSAFQGPELRSASGLFNLMRNLCGAIGIATVNTWLNDATRTQVARFGEALGASGRNAQDFIAASAQRMSAVTTDPDHARLMAQAMIGRVIGREALTIAFAAETADADLPRWRLFDFGRIDAEVALARGREAEAPAACSG